MKKRSKKLLQIASGLLRNHLARRLAAICKSFLVLFFKKEHPSFLAFLLLTTPAASQVTDVKLLAPGRDFGYFVGDTITLEASLSLAPGTEIEPHSLPAPGQVGPGLDVTQVSTQQIGPAWRLRVTYQNFVAPEEAMQVRIPGYRLEFYNGARHFTAQIPFWSFYTSPFRHERQATTDPAALRPDHAIPPMNLRVWRTLSLACLALSVLAALVLAHRRGWLPRLGARSRPFAQAARQVARLARAPAPDYAQILLALHRAFDATAGRPILSQDVPRFIAEHPRYQPLHTEIELFFRASRQNFFANDNAAAPQLAPVPKLGRLARNLRQAERAS